MKATDDGGPAFPVPDWWDRPDGGKTVVMDGMSLRDYFADSAMRSLIAKLPFLDREGEHGTLQTQDQINEVVRQVCRSAYGYADAMLAARQALATATK